MGNLVQIDLKTKMAPKISVVKLCDGLGFGEGSISRAAVENQPGNEDLSRLTDEAINSSHSLVPISHDSRGHVVNDDGCGDGRNIMKQLNAVFSKERNFAKSLYRPKVFGGGAAMAVAMLIGLDKTNNKSLQEAFHDAIERLNKKGLDFGAHIDNHATGENSGCGAIDKAPLVVAAAVKYQEQIQAAIIALGFDGSGLDEIFRAYANYASVVHGQTYSGREVMNEIFENHKIIKELADEHKETRIVLNAVEGYTVDQEYVRLKTNGRAHVFAVDVWRLRQLADGVWEDETDKRRGLLAELIYTLATAAVLTAGNLSVYVIQLKT